jgi:hypothetical protein
VRNDGPYDSTNRQLLLSKTTTILLMLMLMLWFCVDLSDGPIFFFARLMMCELVVAGVGVDLFLCNKRRGPMDATIRECEATRCSAFSPLVPHRGWVVLAGSFRFMFGRDVARVEDSEWI